MALSFQLHGGALEGTQELSDNFADSLERLICDVEVLQPALIWSAVCIKGLTTSIDVFAGNFDLQRTSREFKWSLSAALCKQLRIDRESGGGDRRRRLVWKRTTPPRRRVRLVQLLIYASILRHLTDLDRRHGVRRYFALRNHTRPRPAKTTR